MLRKPKPLDKLGVKGKVALCFSGGIDSFVGRYYLEKEYAKYVPVYFDLKTRYSAKERDVIEKAFNDITVDESLAWLGQHEEGDHAFVPYRNLYLAMTASVRYASNVCICGLADDIVEDKNREVFKIWSEHLSLLSRKTIKVFSPFWDMTKSDVVRWYLETGGDRLKLLGTVSCYSASGDRYCGRCRSCFRKCVALRVNGIDAPFYDDTMVEEYQKVALAGKYIWRRNNDILTAFPLDKNSGTKL